MIVAATADPPVPLHENPDVHARRWTLLGVMCLSLVMVVMAVSSLNVAVPTMQEDLQATQTQLHWIIDAYAIVFAGLLLPAGALGDRYGRKGALLLGLVVFAIGLFIGGMGDSAGQVITGRAIMGAGAAFVMPATLSLITSVFPPGERTKAIAIWAGFAGAGGALGPLVSGAMLEHFWWGSAMLLNLPVVALAMGAIALLAPKSRDSHATPLDPVGSVLSLAGVATLLYGIIEGAERGWTDGLVLGSFVASALLLVAFVAWERRSSHPMLPMHLFADRRFSVGSAVVTLTFLVMFAFFFLVSLYLQYVRGYSALNTGFAMLPLPIALIMVSPRSATLGERFGINRVIATGFVNIALGLLIFSQVSASTPYPLVALGFVFMGAGLGMAAAPATGSIMSAVPLDKAGVGSAVNDTTRELGAALGVAVFGSVAGSLYRGDVNFADQGLEGEQLGAAEESIGGAWRVAEQMPGGAGDGVLEPARDAFTDAFHMSNMVSVAVAVGAAVLVFFTLRSGGRRGRNAEALEAAEPAGNGSAPSGLEPAEVVAG